VQGKKSASNNKHTSGDNRIEKQSLDYAIIKNNCQLLKNIFK
jgi:hypothetical protein